jgi:hypothetical protein
MAEPKTRVHNVNRFITSTANSSAAGGVAALRRRLFGLCKEISASLAHEGDERQARIEYTNRALARIATAGSVAVGSSLEKQTPTAPKSCRGYQPVSSWRELTPRLARALLRQMQLDLGRDPAARRNFLIGKLAAELFGSDWDRALHERLAGRPYFHYGSLSELDGRKAHGLIEEFISRLARRDGTSVETVRARLSSKLET